MMKFYPTVMTEGETLEQAIAGRSISRLGDGEMRLATGGRAPSQQAHEKLASELMYLIRNNTHSLVCLPNVDSPNPVMWFWKKYTEKKWCKLFDYRRTYGSTWVTRPDCAPWINNERFYDRLADLWRGKDVTLVCGDEKSLTVDTLKEAASVRIVRGPRQHAYEVIDQIEEEIGRPSGPVLMCLGATATVLAERLASKNVHALDLGHVGMFMKRFRKNANGSGN